jgi:hypothetical protein
MRNPWTIIVVAVAAVAVACNVVSIMVGDFRTGMRMREEEDKKNSGR